MHFFDWGIKMPPYLCRGKQKLQVASFCSLSITPKDACIRREREKKKLKDDDPLQLFKGLFWVHKIISSLRTNGTDLGKALFEMVTICASILGVSGGKISNTSKLQDQWRIILEDSLDPPCKEGYKLKKNLA